MSDKMPIDYSLLSDDELTALVAEHVAGWKWLTLLTPQGKDVSCGLYEEGSGTEFDIEKGWYRRGRCENVDQIHGMPAYAKDANAVLVLLMKIPSVIIHLGVDCHVTLSSTSPVMSCPPVIIGEGIARTLPRAACLALLSAVPRGK